MKNKRVLTLCEGAVCIALAYALSFFELDLWFQGGSIGLAMLRVLTGLNVMWFLIPGYAIAIGLSFYVPKIFTAIAFDSGGVASGPMTATFLLPFAQGACTKNRIELLFLGRTISGHLSAKRTDLIRTPNSASETILAIYFSQGTTQF